MVEFIKDILGKLLKEDNLQVREPFVALDNPRPFLVELNKDKDIVKELECIHKEP